jgi:hypothetical protein
MRRRRVWLGICRTGRETRAKTTTESVLRKFRCSASCMNKVRDFGWTLCLGRDASVARGGKSDKEQMHPQAHPHALRCTVDSGRQASIAPRAITGPSPGGARLALQGAGDSGWACADEVQQWPVTVDASAQLRGSASVFLHIRQQRLVVVKRGAVHLQGRPAGDSEYFPGAENWLPSILQDQHCQLVICTKSRLNADDALSPYGSTIGNGA